MNQIRIVIADDERPARSFLKTILGTFIDVRIVGEAENGAEAVEIIKREKPDLALLDLQMPEAGGLDVVKLLRKNQLPLVAFVTAYDEFAVRAFEVGAVDYLLKPVDRTRLRATVDRAQERLESAEARVIEAARLKSIVKNYNTQEHARFLERVPVRHRGAIFLVPVSEIVTIVADGELLDITTFDDKTYSVNYRLKELESKLTPGKFVRLSRGTLANIDMVLKITPLAGGVFSVTMKNKQEITSSRLQSRILREKILRM
jgi:two-component system, LytTR family, response regulator